MTIKKSGPSAASPLQEIIYKIEYKNEGGIPVSGVFITDYLPVQAKFVSASDGGFLQANIVKWNIGNLGIGQSDSLILKVKIKENALGMISNVACINNGQTEPVCDFANTFVSNLSKSGPFYSSSRIISYTISYSNIINSMLTSAVIVDRISNDATFLKCIDTQCSYDNRTQEVTWNIKTVQPMETRSVRLEVRIEGNPTFVCNTAKFYSTQTNWIESNRVCIILALPRPPNLRDPPSFKKTVSSSEAYRGDVLQFTLEINNLGDGSAYNVTWTDHQPMYIDYVPGTTKFELYDVNKVLISSGNASDPLVIHNEDGSTTLVFGNIVPEIGPGETLKIFYESKISNNTPVGITLQNEAWIESYSDSEENVYTEGAYANVSVKIVEKNLILKNKGVFSFEPLASNTMNNCCLPKREEALRLLSEAKEKNLDTKEVELILKEADSLLEKAEAFYRGGKYIAANNHALKACEMYKKAVEILRKILGL